MLEQILIADTPDVGEARSLDIAAIADREAIAPEVRVHVVETAEAAVQEAALVAELVHDLAPGHDIRVAGPLDDAFARNRRKRRADCFETANGAGAGCIRMREQQALRGQCVEARRQIARVTVADRKSTRLNSSH